ncbi:MAG: TonB-dependent receptor [Pseudomonadota bacterium]
MIRHNTLNKSFVLTALVFVLLGSGPLLAQEERQVDLPAQPLQAALAELGALYGVTIVARGELTADKSGAPVAGTLSLDQALEMLLADTDLDVRRSQSGSAIITKKSKEVAVVPASSRSAPSKPRRPPAEEIVVRGELLERPIQQTQTSVSLVSGEELDKSVDKDIFDVIDRLPGVSAIGGGFGFVIRGVTDRGVGGGSAQAISVQIDGASVPNGQALSTGSLSTWDLEQVEFLLGSQSTQQGPNSLAGAVVLRSKAPTFDQEFKGRADYGTFNEMRLAVAANLPINDAWAFRFSAEQFETDGDIRTQTTGVETGGEFLDTYRDKLRFSPNERFDAVLTYTHSNNLLGDQSIIDTEFPANRFSQQIFREEGTTDTVALRVNYALTDSWSLTSETAFLQSDYDLLVPPQPIPGNTPAFRTVDDTSTSQELKLVYASDRLTGVVGIYYQRFEKELAFEASIPDTTVFGLPPGTAVFGNGLDNDTENLAVFTEFEFDVNERWIVTAGFRFDSEQQDNISTNSSVFIPDPFGISSTPAPVDLDADYSAFLPKIAAVYRFNEDVSLGITAQRAYRAGGSATDFVSAEQYEFDPEFTNTIDISFRSLLADGAVTLNANAFYTEYTDMQVSVPGPTNTFVDARIENAGQATLWGVELLTEWRPTDAWDLFVSVGYNETEFDEYIGGFGANVIDLSGNEFPQAPSLTGSLGGTYYFMNGFFANVSVSHTDDIFFAPTNLPADQNEPFTLVNAQLGYATENWSVRLYGRNVLDEEYLSIRRADGFSSAGDPRVVGISVTADF